MPANGSNVTMRAAAIAALALALAVALAATPVAAAERGPLFPILEGGKWGYVDRAGRVAIAPRFERAARFSEGLAAVVDGAVHGYVDATGKVVLVPEHAPGGTGIHRPFKSGRAAVRAGDRYGYMDARGKLVIPARYTAADDFSEGLAMVCEPAGCGYVDATGRGAVGYGFMASSAVK